MLLSRAAEVEEIALELIHDESRHLSNLSTVYIDYLFFADAKGKLANLSGKTLKQSGIPAALIRGIKEEFEGVDPADCERFTILINRHIWRFCKEPRQREAIVYHQLLRCGTDEKGKLAVEEPDIMAFSSEVKIYGEELQSVRYFLKALTDSGQVDMDFTEAESETGDGARAHGMDPELAALPPPMLQLTSGQKLLTAAVTEADDNVIDAEFVTGETEAAA